MPETDRRTWHVSCSLHKSIKFNSRITVYIEISQFHISYIGFDSLLGRGGKLMNSSETELEKPSFWQLVFSQSKVNGALYLGEQLPGRTWEWPKNTYFQRRLRQLRWYQTSERFG
jgi:hypothetical protein